MLSIYLSMVETEEEKDLVTELYNTYKQILFDVSMSILHNKADAEDAVQESFIRIIKNITKIDDVKSSRTKAFCVVITKKLSLDILGKRNKLIAVPDEELDKCESECASEDAVFSDIGVELLKSALRMLPPDYYDIILLNVMYNCSISELANVMNLSYEAAKSRLRRARIKLKKELENIDYE